MQSTLINTPSNSRMDDSRSCGNVKIWNQISLRLFEPTMTENVLRVQLLVQTTLTRLFMNKSSAQKGVPSSRHHILRDILFLYRRDIPPFISKFLRLYKLSVTVDLHLNYAFETLLMNMDLSQMPRLLWTTLQTGFPVSANCASITEFAKFLS